MLWHKWECTHLDARSNTLQPARSTAASLPQDAEWEHRRASNKIRFIKAVIQGTLVISNRWGRLERAREGRGLQRAQPPCWLRCIVL